MNGLIELALLGDAAVRLRSAHGLERRRRLPGTRAHPSQVGVLNRS